MRQSPFANLVNPDLWEAHTPGFDLLVIRLLFETGWAERFGSSSISVDGPFEVITLVERDTFNLLQVKVKRSAIMYASSGGRLDKIRHLASISA